jgi:penicillin-binding protein 1A
MTVDPDRDELDARLRRVARESLDQHRRSVDPDETERALQSTRARLGSAPVRGRWSRRMVALSAAAALVALVGALVAVSGARETSVTDDPMPANSDASTTSEVSTTVESMPSTSVASPLVPVPAVAFDVDGNPLAGFGAGDATDEQRTAFADVLLDYLVNRSDILGDTVAERESMLDTAGLRIHTTLDPDAQSAAEAAREVLPSTSAGFGTAIMSLDTDSAAVRALVGPPGEETLGGEANMAVAPRETGSAARAFIVAAAIEAGVLADDVIDNTTPCEFPSDEPGGIPFVIADAVSGGIESIRLTTARSYQCGTERLTRIVGLESVVETMYRMTASAYLDPTAVSPAPLPFESRGLSLSAHQLSALDMASGMQTIANEGVHHAPHFVEYIDDADGNRLYTHRDDGERVLSADAALETVDILKDVIYSGAVGRRAALDQDRPAIGVTGTDPDNINAWFVGATPQLTTAVWVGDPAAYTPMQGIPELEAAGYGRNVQGGHFPAVIWKTFTDTALAGTPPTDWARPPEPARSPVRLVVPGVECRATDVGPQPIEPQQPVTSVDLETTIVPCE